MKYSIFLFIAIIALLTCAKAQESNDYAGKCLACTVHNYTYCASDNMCYDNMTDFSCEDDNWKQYWYNCSDLNVIDYDEDHANLTMNFPQFLEHEYEIVAGEYMPFKIWNNVTFFNGTHIPIYLAMR